MSSRDQGLKPISVLAWIALAFFITTRPGLSSQREAFTLPNDNGQPVHYTLLVCNLLFTKPHGRYWRDTSTDRARVNPLDAPRTSGRRIIDGSVLIIPRVMIVSNQFYRIRMASLDSQYTMIFKAQMKERWRPSTALRYITKIIKCSQKTFRCYTPPTMVVLLPRIDVSSLQQWHVPGGWGEKLTTLPRRGIEISSWRRPIEANPHCVEKKNSANPFIQSGLNKNPAYFSKVI